MALIYGKRYRDGAYMTARAAVRKLGNEGVRMSTFRGRLRAASKQLRELKIDEVSSVSAAANPHAKIVLLKNQEREQPMSLIEAFRKSSPGASAVMIAKRLRQARHEGKVSDFAYGTYMAELASSLHPDAATPAAALSKMFLTQVGAIFLAPGLSKLGYSEERELRKSEGYSAADDNDPATDAHDRTAAHHLADGKRPTAGERVNDGQEQEASVPLQHHDVNKFRAQVKQYAKDNNCSFEHALNMLGSKAHRKEKMQRFGSGY